ncbi:hypothetical protein DF145_28210 [Burkholderia stagnalis]|nr:hypothetical protein DF145_28210 [Burkholderia stagnalis]
MSAARKYRIVDAERSACFASVEVPIEAISCPRWQSLSECLCVRHKLMAKEPRYATQTQGRSDD